MSKKIVCIILIIAMILGIMPMTMAAEDTQTIYLLPDNFKDNLGTWIIEKYIDAYDQKILFGRSDANVGITKDAFIDIPVNKDGEYYLWVRTRDYTTDPGTRTFIAKLGDTKFDTKLGNHGVNGWEWQLAGKTTVSKGMVRLSLIDNTARFARCNVICLTNDSKYTPPNEDYLIKSEIEKYQLPVAAKPTVAPTEEPQVIQEKNGYFAYFGKEAFEDNMGSWTIEKRMFANNNTEKENGMITGETIMGIVDQNLSLSEDAKMTFEAPIEGEYLIWAHTRDFDTNPGSRIFKIKVNDTLFGTILGKHGVNSWKWELAGKIFLEQGENNIYLVDASGMRARCDGIFVTTDTNYNPPEGIALETEFNELLYKDKMHQVGEIIQEEEVDAGPRPEGEVAVKLNGKWLTFDVEPIIMNGRTMVPFRAIFEALGCGVDWNDTSQTAIGERNGVTVKLPIGDKKAVVNGKTVTLDQEAILLNGRTLVPLRIVSESLGARVKWDEETSTVTINGTIPKASFFLRPESFEILGTWVMESNLAIAFNSTTLRGYQPKNGEPEGGEELAKKTSPAISTINVATEGEYNVWVHSRDYKNNQPGARHFKVGIDDTVFDKKHGTHGNDGFAWVKAETVKLTKGKHQVKLYDTAAFYGRCDGIFITMDLDYVPSDDYNELLKLATPVDKSIVDVSFPSWAKATANPKEVAKIENDKVRVIFYEVLGNNGSFIKKETYIKDGNEIKVETLEDDFGYIMLRALESSKSGYDKEFTVYKQTYEYEGQVTSSLTSDIYKTGDPNWLIPKKAETIGENKVRLYFDNEYIDAFATWEIGKEDNEPKVSLDFTAKKEGCYSIGSYSGPAIKDEDYDFALLPYRIQSKRIPDNNYLITEMFAFTPMAAITLKDGNKITKDKVTYGLVVEPEWIEPRWVYRDNTKFGLTFKNQDGLIQPAVFSPLFGSEECKFEVGDSYNFKYRPTYAKVDWFDNYLHITKDLFNIRDYRTNTYGSINDAIFNTRILMMDDIYGGWDNVAKAHYNMEGRNMTSTANSIEAVQTYMLTEDKEILDKRTVPTIASMLSRETIHFYQGGDVTGGGDFFNEIKEPYPVGKPITAFKTNGFGAVYEMSQGRMPYMLDIALDIGKDLPENLNYGSVTSFVNDVAMYKYTNDKAYLDKAKASADKYLEKIVFAPQKTYVDWQSFIFMAQYPSLASMMDIYEATKEEKYLKGAVEIGKWLTTCLWVPGIDGNKAEQEILLDPDVFMAIDVVDKNSNFSFWHGDQVYRIGSTDGGDITQIDTSKLKKETVPYWYPSRVGLGLEQTSTFGTSKNIIMSTWAGDLMKLAQLSGEEYFEICARNAIVGRFSNYSGYYSGRLSTIQMQENYPYEGPDITGIFWHHIPPFLAMLEDFLISQTYNWSDGKIDFPSIKQYGYAYFNSNQYGFAPGKVYDEEEMWLWLDEGIIETDTIQLDWLGAKKDGTLAIMLMNEDSKEISTKVALGDKVIGGNEYNGKALVYDENGIKSEIDVVNGEFTLTIPSKKLKTVIIKLPQIKKPDFAQSYTYKNETMQTVAEHENGKGYIIQLSPDLYHAYVYTTYMATDVKEVTINYEIGQEKGKETTNVYPFEFIVKVDDPKKDFAYSLEIIKADGTKETTTKKVLSPIR